EICVPSQPAPGQPALELTTSTASGRAARVSIPSSAERLYERIVTNGESFWEAVRDPFLRRDLPKADVREFVEFAYRKADYSYTRLAGLLGLASERKKLENFLTHHRLKAGHGCKHRPSGVVSYRSFDE